MARFAPAALVAALLIATAGAFAYTERLKLTPSPITGTRVDKLFSPTCECETEVAEIRFRLAKRDRVTVTIVAGDRTVRTLAANAPEPRGVLTLQWDGRDDSGLVVRDGSYKPRVHLALSRRTITLPNPILVDTRPPQVELRRLSPRVFSPDGDGRADRVVVTYRVDEPAHVALYVDGRRVALKHGTRETGTMTWNGRDDGRAFAVGPHRLTVLARDVAGNLGARTRPQTVVLRYVSVGRTLVEARAGRRFPLLVQADARTIEWRLGARSGTVRPGTVHLRAPARPGRYALVLRVGDHAVRVAVVVRAGS